MIAANFHFCLKGAREQYRSGSAVGRSNDVLAPTRGRRGVYQSIYSVGSHILHQQIGIYVAGISRLASSLVLGLGEVELLKRSKVMLVAPGVNSR